MGVAASSHSNAPKVKGEQLVWTGDWSAASACLSPSCLGPLPRVEMAPMGHLWCDFGLRQPACVRLQVPAASGHPALHVSCPVASGIIWTTCLEMTHLG